MATDGQVALTEYENVFRINELRFGFHKHLTTLSAGTIVLLATFLKKETMANTNCSYLFGCLLLMIVGVICGYIGMAMIIAIQHDLMTVTHILAGAKNKQDAMDIIHGNIDRLLASGTKINSVQRIYSLVLFLGSISFVVGQVMLVLFVL